MKNEILRRHSEGGKGDLKALLCQYLPEETVKKIVPVILMDKHTVILIDGKQGATGKTTLCNALNELGFNAREMWKYAYELAEVREDRITSKQNQNSSVNSASVIINLNRTFAELSHKRNR